MPVPKRKRSRANKRKKATHLKLTAPTVTKCPNCGEPVLSHRVCPSCGYYKNRQVREVKEEA